MNIINEAKKEQEFIVTIRRHLHENPELSGIEFKTIELIKNKINEFNIPFIEVKDGGILAFIDSNKKGKTILLRADVDALPINESEYNGAGKIKPCISKVENVQHACGHDAHTAMLLAASKILNNHKDEFKGKIIICFERGEEGIGNVYYLIKYMLENNIHYDQCFGVHVSFNTEYKPGSILIKEGNFMAAMITYKFKIIGKGGHGGKPETCISPINAFTYVYQAIEDLYQKEYFDKPLRFSCGKLESGLKCNVIPDELTFEGTIRYFNNEDGKEFSQRIIEICQNVAEKHGCRLIVEKMSKSGLAVINDSKSIEMAKKAFKDFEINEAPLKMSSESFCYYQAMANGIFANLNTANIEKGMISDIHTSSMDVDEDVLYLGSAAHIAYALEFLNNDYNFSKEPLYKNATQWQKEFGKI